MEMNKALSIAMVSGFQLTLWEALQSVEVFIGGEGFACNVHLSMHITCKVTSVLCIGQIEFDACTPRRILDHRHVKQRNKDEMKLC